MKINDKVIDKVAGLAKLEFEGVEKEALKKETKRLTSAARQTDLDAARPLPVGIGEVKRYEKRFSVLSPLHGWELSIDTNSN